MSGNYNIFDIFLEKSLFLIEIYHALRHKQ